MKWLTKRLEKYNVGYGATRTSTLAEITKDEDRALMKERKGTLSLTDCGAVSYKLLDGCQIASPEATEKLFNQMEAVGRFELDADDVVNSVTDMVVHDLAVMKKERGEAGQPRFCRIQGHREMPALRRRHHRPRGESQGVQLLLQQGEAQRGRQMGPDRGLRIRDLEDRRRQEAERCAARKLSRGHDRENRRVQIQGGQGFRAKLRLAADKSGKVEFVFDEKGKRK